ncbi:hypothetical protein ACET3X_009424 [Alternaria dauci]|uniref:LisH domain-containing protein n=1 Tax=Alternaria dauci TaxID=48095 RepID=A0ABR3U9W9_9PLEO
MAKPALTEKLVYLALKDVFRGDGVQPSTPEEIRKKIEKHKSESRIGALIQNHGMESVCKVAQDLLKYQIFVSMAKAEVRFPDVFEVLPTQVEQQTTAAANTATSSATVVRNTGTYNSEEFQGTGDRIKSRKGKEKARSSSQNQALDSISLPLWDQHRVLVKVQHALEEACFSFAQTRLENVLQNEGWDCAEAVELNWWPKYLLAYQEECNLNNLQDVDKPLPNLLDSVTQLRHYTVHRVRLSSDEIIQHLTDALMLAQLLQDDNCSKFISTVRQRTQDAIEELVRNKAILDRRLDEIKTSFAEQRAELDRQEAASLEAAVREHVRPNISVSGSLDSSCDELGGTDATQAPGSHDHNSATPDDEPPESEGILATQVIASATEPAAELAVTQIPDAADEDNERAEEVKKKPKEEKKKKLKEEKKKGKKKNKVVKEQAKQQEEAEQKTTDEGQDIAEPASAGGAEDGTFQHSHEDITVVKQLFMPSRCVPTIDNDSIKQALADEKEEAQESNSKNQSEEEQFFECSEISVGGHESDSHQPSTHLLLERQAVATDSTDLISKEKMKAEMASDSDPTGSGLLARRNLSLDERIINTTPTCLRQTENHADESHTKSETEDGISTENGIVDPGASSEQPAATNGPSYLLRSWGQGSWSGSVRIKSLEDDPRLKSLTAANGKGRVTLVST